MIKGIVHLKIITTHLLIMYSPMSIKGISIKVMSICNWNRSAFHCLKNSSTVILLNIYSCVALRQQKVMQVLTEIKVIK